MNFQRTATIIISGAALAAWLSVAATSTRDVADPMASQPSPFDARGAELANEIARLHERLRPSATPRQPGRNLFAFRTSPAPAPRVVTPPPAPVVETVTQNAQPALKLVGLAEDPGPDGPSRTAIISSDGQLFIVREGENVTARYRVARISGEVVELLDVGDGSFRRLALR